MKNTTRCYECRFYRQTFPEHGKCCNWKNSLDRRYNWLVYPSDCCGLGELSEGVSNLEFEESTKPKSL
jgi:hypothetical protein